MITTERPNIRLESNDLSDNLRDVVLSLSKADLGIFLQSAYQVLVVEKVPLNDSREVSRAIEAYRASLGCALDQGVYRK